MERQKRNLDLVLDNFSICGQYHIKFMFCAWFAYATNTLYTSNYIFAAEETSYRCKDESFENNTCSGVNGLRCLEWVYDNPHSFVAEFQLACQEWKRTLVGTSHSFGYMIGLFIVGPLSDRIGRKKTIILTGVMSGVLGLVKSFVYSYRLYIILEFMEAAIGDLYSPVYILNMEIVSAKKRVKFYCICAMGFSIGGFLLPFAAWGVPYWRHFLRVIYTPSLLFITGYFILDESPRWLLTKGHKHKVVTIVQKMDYTNKDKFNGDDLDELLIEHEEENVGFIHLLKMTLQSRTLIKRCLVCIVWWTASTFVNYGMRINAVSLQGNKYLNYALVMIATLPANLILMYILTYYKRKKPLIFCFFASGLLCLVQPFLPRGHLWLSMTTYMVGKMVTYIYFRITYMYTTELFPTYTRNSMQALCSSIGRIGSIIAPQTPLLMTYWTGLPSVVFGGVSLLGGLVTVLVPDTANNPLPDTVQQAEAIGTKPLNNPMQAD